jgi:hypothetical protein
MLGQAHHFRMYAPTQIDYAIERYTREATRLYTVIEKRLWDSEFSPALIRSRTWQSTLGSVPIVGRGRSSPIILQSNAGIGAFMTVPP